MSRPTEQVKDRAVPLAAHVLVGRYVGFAIVSTVLNLGFQEIAFRLSPAYKLYVSILVGTAVGFIFRYALEKKWVFYDSYDSHGDEARKFILYGLCGVFTTIIFWGFEIAAAHATNSVFGKYAGAVIGLTIGYVVKYHLDKQYVFRPGSAL